MKYPMMLVCALVASMSLSVIAETATTGTATTTAKTEKAAKHGQLTQAEKEARINKTLEQIKAKDEALYKELVALREKDPAAFNAKLREWRKQQMQAAKATKAAKAEKK